jgi:hypothetical protein
MAGHMSQAMVPKNDITGFAMAVDGRRVLHNGIKLIQISLRMYNPLIAR